MKAEDAHSCGECGCQEGPMFLHSKCHTGFPTWVSVQGATLKITCAYPDCGREVGTFQLAVQ